MSGMNCRGKSLQIFTFAILQVTKAFRSPFLREKLFTKLMRSCQSPLSYVITFIIACNCFVTRRDFFPISMLRMRIESMYSKPA